MTIFFVRPESHEIDSLARRRVPLAFPKGWEHRELTGRDYGIDMILEIFDNGIPTGKSLSLQIKGISVDVDESVQEIKFDIPVRTLLYSEMFISPVLLVICPVNQPEIKIFYLWLQEYIGVVLNHDHPTWRQNKTKVRVSIPIDNQMPGDESKLSFLAGFPKRVFEWCQYARICEDLKYDLNSFFETDSIDLLEIYDQKSYEELMKEVNRDLENIIEKINEIMNLKHIFNEQNWRAPQAILKNVLKPALESAQRLLNNSSINHNLDNKRIAQLTNISSLLSLYNDYSFSRVLWKNEGIHDF